MPRAAGLVQLPPTRQLIAVEGEVIVPIDEPGQHGHAGDVDQLRARWPRGRRPGAHGLDAAVGDDDRRVRAPACARCRRSACHHGGPAWDDLLVHGCEFCRTAPGVYAATPSILTGLLAAH